MSSEHNEQVALMFMVRDDERFRWLYAIPNGGARDVRTGVKLKAEGVKAGVPDLYLSLPVGEYKGMYVEMKFGKNKLTAKQKQFLDHAALMGYKTAVCYSAEEAYQVLMDYVGGAE